MSDQTNQHPRLGVAVLIRQDNKSLLVKRGKEPNYGLWVIPGGGVKFGEPWRETARREAREETGLEIEILETNYPYVIQVIGENEHRIILCFIAMVVGGTLQAGSDALEARFFYDKEIIKSEVSPVVWPVLKEYCYI